MCDVGSFLCGLLNDVDGVEDNGCSALVPLSHLSAELSDASFGLANAKGQYAEVGAESNQLIESVPTQIVCLKLIEVADHTIQIHNQNRKFLPIGIVQSFFSHQDSLTHTVTILACRHLRNVLPHCVASIDAGAYD